MIRRIGNQIPQRRFGYVIIGAQDSPRRADHRISVTTTHHVNAMAYDYIPMELVMVTTRMTHPPVRADEERRHVSFLLQVVHGVARLHAEQKSLVDLDVGAVLLVQTSNTS